MDSITLYHGSRGGIVGDIKPISRERCDFGRGFYMGTNPDQAKSLVAHDQAPYFYKINLDLKNISEDRVLTLSGMDWAYYILYNRDRLNSIKGSELYSRIKHIGDGKDIIIGPIADDAMNESMKKFVNGEITDKAFLESIKVINYGVQYVAKTEEACKHINILSEKELYGKELTDALILSERRLKEGTVKANEMQRKYRREGKYLDEIIKNIKAEMDKNEHDR